VRDEVAVTVADAEADRPVTVMVDPLTLAEPALDEALHEYVAL
jgi:hypothetical protein